MRLKIVAIFILLITSLFAYDFSMINLIHPSGLKQKQAEIMIQHRFYGDITDDPLNNFLGMDAGANVSLSARYQFIRKAEAKLSYTRQKNEKILGLAYRVDVEDFPVYGQLGVDYFSYEELSQPETTRQNFFYHFSLQNEEIMDRFTATLNTAYDGYNQRLVFGLGMTIKIMDSISFLGEYYPVLDRDSASEKLAHYIGDEDAFALGIKFDTFGHQFIFLLTNPDDIGLRRTSLGAAQDSHLRLGFNIQRRLEW